MAPTARSRSAPMPGPCCAASVGLRSRANARGEAGASPLFQALRAERARLAKQQGVPPYVVFHDTTLAEMAARRPRDLDAMSTIQGIGTTKLSRYGDAFLAVINAEAGGRSRSEFPGV